MADKRKRKRKAYSLKQVKLVGSQAIWQAENILLSDKSTDAQKLQACNTISTLLNSYARLYESYELEIRVQQLEERYAKNT